MKWSIIYHYWNDSSNCEVWRDVTNPIVVAIATFRAHNIAVPIFVIDCSCSWKRNNWGHYPFWLKFEVVRRPLDSSVDKLLSRAWDIPAVASDLDADCYVFSDTDIFWVKDIFPLGDHIDGFYCNSVNNGLFYWNRDSPSAEKVFKKWQLAIKYGMEDEAARSKILAVYYAPTFNDEAAYCYVKHKNPNLIRDISLYDNWVVDYLTEQDATTTKNVHFCQGMYGKNKGLYALLIKEFYDAMMISLREEDMARIYGERALCRARTFDLVQLHKVRLLLNDRRRIFV